MDTVTDIISGAMFAINFGNIDLSAVTMTIAAGVPVVMPTVVGLIGMRKGLNFVLGMIKGA
jgi:hypothetical protein